MPSIKPEDVAAIARLARLRLDDTERDALSADLVRILEYVETLSELDTSEVEPTAQVGDATEPFRADEPQPSLDRDEALANAPATHEGSFLVPKVIDD